MNNVKMNKLIFKPCVYFVGMFAWQMSAYASAMVDAFRLGEFDKAAKIASEKASGAADEQFALAEMLLYGYGLPKNNDKAIEAYTKAAEQNYLPALQVMARYELNIKKRPEEALVWFKKAAELQDLPSLKYCSAAYLYGLGTTKNEDMARKYFIPGAKLGDPLSQLTLAEHFFASKQSSNTQLAWLWLNKACDKNYQPALLLKAKFLSEGYKIAANPQMAAEIVEKLIAQNYLPAYVLKAQWAISQKQWDIALNSLKTALDRGYHEAQLPLAELYANKESSVANNQLAFQLMQKAANDYNKDAQKRLSEFYQNGVGVEANQQLATDWLNRSKKIEKIPQQVLEERVASWLSAGTYKQMDQGEYHLKGIWSDWHNPETLLTNRLNAPPKFIVHSLEDIFQPNYQMVQPNQIALTEYLDAIMKLKGPLVTSTNASNHYELGVNKPLNEQDFNKLKQQAFLGVAESQFILGMCYLQGIQVPVNREEARNWFAKAMDQEDLRAQYELALLDLDSNDEGLQKQSLNLLKDAAFKGNPNAEFQLGLLLEQGLKSKSGKVIIGEDLEQAKNMLRLASINDSAMAKFRLAEWLSREPLSEVALNERTDKQNQIRGLYREAAQSGIQEAKLPLAFHEATSTDPKQREWAFMTAQQFANQGDKEAALLVGLMIDLKNTNPNHTQEAMQWYKVAKSHPIGGFVWATLNNQSEKSKEYMQKAANAGFSYAHLNLAVMDHQDKRDAHINLQKAVDEGNFLASHLLANQLMIDAKDDNRKQSFKIFEGLAGKGDAEAQMKLGYMSIYGLGCQANAEKGQEYLLKAAQQKHAVAQFLLGYMNHLGMLGTQPNDAQAKYWFRQAAKQLPKAWVDLGFIYETVDKNYIEANNAYINGSNSNKAPAFYNQGLVYQYGKGMPVDFSRAQLAYDQAAKLGSSLAMLELGQINLNIGSSEHEKLALSWYKKAAKSGQSEAFYRLGLMCETGIGVQPDYAKALSYYKVASEMGDVRAQEALRRINLFEMAKNVEKPQENFVELTKYAASQLVNSPKQESSKVRVELRYLSALDAMNQGQLDIAEQSLNNIIKDFPHFVPAKQLYMQIQKQQEVVKKSV